MDEAKIASTHAHTHSNIHTHTHTHATSWRPQSWIYTALSGILGESSRSQSRGKATQGTQQVEAAFSWC